MNLSDSITKELRIDESIRWSGQGDPRVLFTRADLMLVPFSLLWGGFTIFWETQAIARSSGPLFIAVGAAFVLMGLYLMIGRFFVKTHQKRSTAYAVTTRRAFLVRGNRVIETDLSNADRTITWSQERRHVSVVWNTKSNTDIGIFSSRQKGWPGNTGTDGVLGPTLMAFYDVQDGNALLSALEQSQQSQRI